MPARHHRRRPADGPRRHHRGGSDCVRGGHSGGTRRRRRVPGCFGRRAHHHDRGHDPVGPAACPARQAPHPRCPQGVRRAVHVRLARGDDGHGHVDGHRGRDGRDGRGARHRDGPNAAQAVLRCSRAGWLGGRRRDHTDRRFPDAAARPPDRRRPLEPVAPIAVRNEAHAEAPGAVRCEGREQRERLPVPCWPGHRRRWGHRPRGDAAGDRGAVGASRRALPPSAAVARIPSARAPTVHRDTDCRPHRNRRTARHWRGCGEWGVCVRSFENCKWYRGLRSDLEGSARPRQA